MIREVLHSLTVCSMATALCSQLSVKLLHSLCQGLTSIFLDGRRTAGVQFVYALITTERKPPLLPAVRQFLT